MQLLHQRRRYTMPALGLPVHRRRPLLSGMRSCSWRRRISFAAGCGAFDACIACMLKYGTETASALRRMSCAHLATCPNGVALGAIRCVAMLLEVLLLNPEPPAKPGHRRQLRRMRNHCNLARLSRI